MDKLIFSQLIDGYVITVRFDGQSISLEADGETMAIMKISRSRGVVVFTPAGDEEKTDD